VSIKIKTLLENFDLNFQTYAEEFGLEETALPWGNGAVAVKKALEARYKNRNIASSVISRMGGLVDPYKKKIRDQVLHLFRQEGAALRQMEKDKKSKGKKKSKVSTKLGKEDKSPKQTEGSASWKAFASKHPLLSKAVGGVLKTSLVMAFIHAVATGKEVSLDVFNFDLSSKPKLKKILTNKSKTK
jgi:hypothetical protein